MLNSLERWYPLLRREVVHTPLGEISSPRLAAAMLPAFAEYGEHRCPLARCHTTKHAQHFRVAHFAEVLLCFCEVLLSAPLGQMLLNRPLYEISRRRTRSY